MFAAASVERRPRTHMLSGTNLRLRGDVPRTDVVRPWGNLNRGERFEGLSSLRPRRPRCGPFPLQAGRLRPARVAGCGGAVVGRIADASQDHFVVNLGSPADSYYESGSVSTNVAYAFMHATRKSAAAPPLGDWRPRTPIRVITLGEKQARISLQWHPFSFPVLSFCKSMSGKIMPALPPAD